VTETIKILHDGEAVDAEEMGFKILKDGAVLCEVSDGSRIEIKHEIRHIYRLAKKKEDGSPIYLLVGGADIKAKEPPRLEGVVS